jgi:transposase
MRKLTQMTLYVALDVSLEKSAVCVMDAEGTVIVERVVASDAAALITDFPEAVRGYRLGSRASSEWLVRG